MDQTLHDEICRRLVDDGRLVEAGFEAMRYMSISKDAPARQVEEMRLAFFAGAQHVFASILSMLEPGQEATDKDLARMSQISAELEDFILLYKARRGEHSHGP